MISHILKTIAILLLISVSFGCAHTHDSFQTKIRSMSDMNLISYYHGLNDRIKEIENKEKLDRRPDDSETDRVVSQITFFPGGEGFKLVEKQKKVKREIDRRNLHID